MKFLYARRAYLLASGLFFMTAACSFTLASSTNAATQQWWQSNVFENFFGNTFVQLQEYLAPYRSSLTTVLVNLTYGAIATIVFRQSLGFTRYYYASFYKKIYRLVRRKLPALRIQNLEIINARSIRKGFVSIILGLRFLIFFFLTYLYISFLLNLSPWSQQLAGVLLQTLLASLNTLALTILAYIPNLIILILIVGVAYYLIKISRKVFKEVGKGQLTIPGFYPTLAAPTSNLLTIGIIAFAAVSAFPYLPGGNSPALQGISIFVGVLFSLGSTTVIGNLISGVVLIYTRAFTKGDRVTIGGITGDVVDEALLVTRIRTIKNKIVTIPNGMVLSSYIINFSDTNKHDSGPPLIVHTTITLGYDVPWRKVHKVLIDAVSITKNVLQEPHPFILQTVLNDFYVCYELNAYTDSPLIQELIESELHQNI